MSTERPTVERVRHELKRRTLIVARVERLTPSMVRIVFTGQELAGFTSPGFDDHVKLFFPCGTPDGTTVEPFARRDFTPRRFDAAAGELWIDFFLHGDGPAATWAAQAVPGQTLLVGGPKGSMIIAPAGIDGHVLIGDETALPAIARRLEELPACVRALVLLETGTADAVPPLVSPADFEVVQIARGDQPGTDAPARALIERLREIHFPPGRCFVWVALESQAARAVRRYLCAERGIARSWVKAAGYWQRGSTGAHDVIDDAA